MVTPRHARSAWGALETLHVVAFFAPEVQQAYDAMGVRGARAGYFAARASALGPVGPTPVVATFYVFAPALVERVVPRVWDAAPPADWAAARVAGVGAALHGVLGDPDVTEAVQLARRVCAALPAAGRPLYAAWRDAPWPEDPLLQLWHAALLVREHRGDGHLSALMAAGLDPVESLVTFGLASGSTGFLRSTRGWTDEEWTAGEDRLRLRGLVDDGGLTPAGVDLRRQVEATTDQLTVPAWTALGEPGTRRLRELVQPLRTQLLDSGLLPDWIRARG